MKLFNLFPALFIASVLLFSCSSNSSDPTEEPETPDVTESLNAIVPPSAEFPKKDNSQAPGTVKSPFTGRGDYYCINPVNWRTDKKTAQKTEHRGSRFFDRKSGKAVDRKCFVQAQIDPSCGALIVIPAEPGKYDHRALGQGVYHMFDLNFFYHDLRANGKLRIDAFGKPL